MHSVTTNYCQHCINKASKINADECSTENLGTFYEVEIIVTQYLISHMRSVYECCLD